jgi:hypothetical protein
VTAGLKLGGTTQPVAGVFDVGGFHGNALSILFVCTVIEAKDVGEGEATSCRVIGVTNGRQDAQGRNKACTTFCTNDRVKQVKTGYA